MFNRAELEKHRLFLTASVARKEGMIRAYARAKQVIGKEIDRDEEELIHVRAQLNDVEEELKRM